MKKFLIALLAMTSLNVFADDSGLRCMTEYRSVVAEFRNHTKSADDLYRHSINTDQYILRVASNLIAQQDRIVGSYGYGIQKNGNIALTNTERFNALLKAQEDTVLNAMIKLEDCLYQK